VKKQKPARDSKGKPSRAQKNRKKEDAQDIERAVYDGMQDLRVKKAAGK
jgi:hypothetical protein